MTFARTFLNNPGSDSCESVHSARVDIESSDSMHDGQCFGDTGAAPSHHHDQPRAKRLLRETHRPDGAPPRDGDAHAESPDANSRAFGRRTESDWCRAQERVQQVTCSPAYHHRNGDVKRHLRAHQVDPRPVGRYRRVKTCSTSR